ncbi:hypothetical protein ABW21_db0201857 [Orbilia brochopaga]|nr:hypothetical protein ABW21_db0201857 [Drechslerella brochopaga]
MVLLQPARLNVPRTKPMCCDGDGCKSAWPAAAVSDRLGVVTVVGAAVDLSPPLLASASQSSARPASQSISQIRTSLLTWAAGGRGRSGFGFRYGFWPTAPSLRMEADAPHDRDGRYPLKHAHTHTARAGFARSTYSLAGKRYLFMGPGVFKIGSRRKLQTKAQGRV